MDGGKPRIYRLVLLSCSHPVVLLLLLLLLPLVLGLGGAMGWVVVMAVGCDGNGRRLKSDITCHTALSIVQAAYD